MADPTTAQDTKLAKSATMRKFYRTLTAVTSNAVARVMKEDSADKKIARAEVEIKRLTKEANTNHKCPNGFIWDEFLKRCVPNE